MGNPLVDLVLAYVVERVALGELVPVTARGDRRTLLCFVEALGPVAPAELLPAHVEGYLAAVNVGRSTKRTRLSKIRTFCRWLVRRGHLAADPTVWIRAPRQPRAVPRAYQAAVVRRLVAVVPDARGLLIVLLEVQEGLRACEVSRLELGDVDLGERTMLVRGKGARERLLPVSDETWQALSGYLTERGLRAGAMIRSYTEPWKGITPDHVGRLVQRWLRRVGVAHGGGHGLRHTMATTLLREGGADIRDVQMALGHANLTSTSVYLPFSDTRRLRTVMGGRWYGPGHEATG